MRKQRKNINKNEWGATAAMGCKGRTEEAIEDFCQQGEKL